MDKIRYNIYNTLLFLNLLFKGGVQTLKTPTLVVPLHSRHETKFCNIIINTIKYLKKYIITDNRNN